MKKYAFSAIVLAAAFSMAAEGLDLQSRVMLKRRAFENARLADTEAPFNAHISTKSQVQKSSDSDASLAFVKIADGHSRADLEEAGMTVMAVRGNIAIVALTLDRAEEFAACPAVKKMSLQQPVKPLLDKSRASTGVDDIHRGTGLDVPYTGKGVLAGIVDQGIDPNHVMFQKAGGKSRVEYLTYFNGTADRYGVPNYSIYGDSIYDLDKLGNPIWYPKADDFTTDSKMTYHGTHTMGILAGGYKGQIERAIGLSGKTPVIEKVDNPYYGVATDAQLAVSCGELQDACIAYGLNGILDYASYALAEEGRPSVVSLSLGSNAGAHDKNGLMNQFLDECGKETIVVLAAGNEGDLKISLRKNLTADNNTLSTMIYPYGYRYDPSNGAPGTRNTYYRNDAVYIYSNNETPFEITGFVMTQNEDGTWRKRASYNCSSEEGEYFLSNSYYANYVGGSVNSTIARYFDGYIGGGSMYDEDLGRWYGVFDYYLYTNPETGFNEDGSEAVIVGFEVKGIDGQRIEAYCMGFNTWLSNYGMDGYDDGQYDGTISDMAVTDNTLVVGAYTENRQWTSLNGEDYGYYESDGFVIGDIGHYTSYATFEDGTSLPHICAPGTGIISAMSTPYVEDYFKGYEAYIPMNFQARATVNNRTYYWKAETGTSMSTPFVAGSIALWLEADPTLTIEDVRDIVIKTAKQDEFVKKGIPAQWGAGKFDALAGLKEVIARRNAGIHGIVADSDNNRLIITGTGNNVFDVFVGDANSLVINVFSLTGANVHSSVADGCQTTLDLSGLIPGVYAVNVNGHSKKIAIK